MRSAAYLAAAIVLSVAFAGCSTVTPENFARVHDGMTEAEVVAILGKPDETANVALMMRVKAVNNIWKGGGYTITVQFTNGRVRAKSLEPSAPAKK